jgi:ActR/RegA family two-component response regulator
MYIQYTGFKVAINSRTYSFQVLDATRAPREFTVKIHSDTNHWTGLKIQDGPGICFERLEQELGRETPASCAELNLRISEPDIREYLTRHYPPVKVFGHKGLPEPSAEPFIAPTIAPAAVAGWAIPKPAGDDQKEEVTAVLLHQAGDSIGLLKLALESYSIKVRWLKTVQEVLPLLREATPPHLIFTEAKLPDGTWADVVKQACRASQAVKVIVVSRLVDVSLYVDTMDGGAFDFIVPPLSGTKLDYVVKRAVEKVLDLRRARLVAV